MYLTKEEERALDGEHGEAVEKSMKLLTAIGDIYNARKLVPIKSAQIAGVSYKNIGDAGLEYVRDLADQGARVRVFSTLNPAGNDPERWQEMGVDEAFASKQKEIVEAYARMDILPTCTCSPYEISNIAMKWEHLAWSESSAVVFANSFFGACTNREGGPSSLAAAIVGKTPEYGMHLNENRAGKVLVNVNAKLESGTDYAVMGHYIGGIVGSRVPVFAGMDAQIPYQLKMMGAGLAASGGVPMFHAVGLTPEADTALSGKPEDKIAFGEEELKQAYEALDQGVEEPDIACIGCPHCSVTGLARIAKQLKGKEVSTPTWVFTNTAIKKLADRAGYTKTIEKSGAKVFCDTCFIVSPVEKMGYKSMITNSSKAGHYSSSFCGLKSKVMKLTDLVKEVTK
ncbi:MAG: aconitase X catalytic domain-containing protein [Candidatus Diapherotrites archaeon]|nr:aconitase X catalytic domain-containing protein [Candidatus Diapherotrites archaeon]